MKHFLYLLVFFLPLYIHAERVEESKARDIATHFLKRQLKSRAGNLSLHLVYDGKDLPSRTIKQGQSLEESPFYVYNTDEGNGFVIVSGDDLIHPILGFSTKRPFTVKGMPENLKTWFNDIAQQITWAKQHKLIRSKQVVQAWNTKASFEINPLLIHTTAEWDQGEPYNRECPVVNGQKCPTGCTNTATTIVMRFHQWPPKGKGTIPSYEFSYKNEGIEYKYTMPSRELGEPYRWDLMPLKYNKDTSEESKNQVARLMADCGSLLKTTYEGSGSGAYPELICETFHTFMDYDETAFCFERKMFSSNGWKAKIIEELETNGPLVYTGYNPHDGHAFVVDGYAERDFFHINWGWGSSANGYYLLESTDPEDEHMIMFPNDAYIIAGMKKDNGIKEHLELCYMDGIDNDILTKVNKNSPFYVNFGSLHRKGYNISPNYTIAVWLTDKNGKLKEQLSEDYIVIDDIYGWYYSDKILCFMESDVEPGDRIRLLYKSELNPEWSMLLHSELSIYEYIFKNAQGDILDVEGKVSMDYDRRRKVLTLHYPKDIQIQLWCNDINITPQAIFSEGQCVLHLRRINSSNFFIKLIQGEAQKNILFMI